MQHFADDNYDIEKVIARYEGLPFLLKRADLEVGRADLDPYTPEDQHFRPHPKRDSGPAAAAPPPPPGDPNCPYCQGAGCEQCEFSSCANCQGRGCEKCLQDIHDRYNGNKYEGKKSSDLNSQPFANPVPLADAPGTTPGNKPIDEVLEAAPSAVGHGPDKTSSQGDKPSPHAAQAVFEALAGGNEDEAKELLKQTDCPDGCETHPEGKCNHGFMSAGRTRVRYLVNDSSFDKEAGFFNDVMQIAPDMMHAAPHVWNEINPAGNGFVGQGIGAIGDAIDAGISALRDIFPNTDNPQFQMDVSELQTWHNAHPGPEYAAEWTKKVDGFVNFWRSQGIDNPGNYISR